jgi:hypothetical protein
MLNEMCPASVAGHSKAFKCRRFRVWHSDCPTRAIMRLPSLFGRAAKVLVDVQAVDEVEPAVERLLAPEGAR